MKYKIFTLLLASALTSSAFAQTGSTPDASGSGSNTNSRQVETEPRHDYGWIGLLGLAGLAGLRRQHHPETVDTRRS